jgi:dienelactone hydrolase
METLKSWLKTAGEKIGEGLLVIWAELRLPSGWARGPAVSVGILVMVFLGYFGYDSQSGYGRAVDVFVPVVLGGVAYYLLLVLGGALVRQLLRLPPSLWVIAALGIVAGLQVWGDRTWVNWVLNVIMVGAAIMIGMALYALRREGTIMEPRKRLLHISSLMIGISALLYIAGLWLKPGTPAPNLPVSTTRGAPAINASDPSQPGNYDIEYLTYGSGEERFRPEFGDDVDLVTEPVDASRFVTYSGWNGRLRKWFWRYDENAFPLNGRVWMPQGEGPFPLVLIVHGNHNMVDYSDAGYDYLGELMASRGFIFVSVDQNFLNGSMYGKSTGENDARAWMLLEHLAQWESWHREPASPFFQKVDLDRVALIGHSRGGEAAALATTFNSMTQYPGNARIRWNYGFGIRAVAAIAPVDQQWLPADHPNPLENISYLVIQGSHDADLYYYDGIQQYQRAKFSNPDSGAFKSAFYIYRANHGQFNTSWGDRDAGAIGGAFLNRESLLPATEQRQIAKVLLSAFLEITLNGKDEYLEIFKDQRTAGDWLPETGYVTQYEDQGFQIIADFEEDIDPATATLDGATIYGASLSRWREKSPRFRNGDRQDNHAVSVGWTDFRGQLRITLPTDLAMQLSNQSVLVFQAADERELIEVSGPLDFSVVMIDQLGRGVSIPITEVLPLQSQFPAIFYKIDTWNQEFYNTLSEPVFQTYRIPLSLFLARNPDLDTSRIREIRFVFDQMDQGRVFLDEVGFDLTP